ncbi:multidrug ABC transporter ATP-binding protein [Kitasatospora albolonga]|uniref:Multidrug ABC transporter ATP-binding protein n=1 Tax=Kitasatospora albolonga TaxID=68173 RepID=A0ABC8BWV4_9ACTN|nr:multidrug ABC transporter ATP-binding protein [Kitasatospora albolonga]
MPEPFLDHVICATDVWRRYGPAGERGFDAVRGVGFTVGRGETFGLLGTNGAGKTSTLELLEGLAAPARGTIRLFGEHDPVRDRARIRPRTGVMLQEGGFASDLTVAETVRMWSRCVSTPRPTAEALGMTGLGGRSGVLVKNLSGGEKRRLDLTLALLGRPELLFLDEPTTGMDPEGRHETWDIIKGLQEQGTTVVLTTHYLEEAEVLADRVAIMHRGRIAASGPVSEITGTRPATIAFRMPPDTTLADLGTLPELGATGAETEPGGPVRLTTDDLQHTATEALLRAREKGITLTGLEARSASLEEVFLHIAGRHDETPGRTLPGDTAHDTEESSLV